MLFDFWAINESPLAYYTPVKEISPSRKYTITISRSKDYEESLLIVYLIENSSHKQKVIARGIRGIRGIGITWYSTQLGDIAVIDHDFDTHQNVIYVVIPTCTDTGEMTLNLLYKTLDIDLFPKQMINVDHSYWTVKSISYDGDMIITCSWDFFRYSGSSGQSKKFTIPLFYGYHPRNMGSDPEF